MRIQKINAVGITADKVPELFSSNNVQYHSVDNVNWPDEYPYKPDFKFAIAHDKDHIYIHYKVSEKTSRAIEENDCGHIWEDSCAEFFFAPDNGGYYNFECSCIGRLLIEYGPDRNERHTAPSSVLKTVQRWSSVGRDTFEEKACGPWELVLVIPVSAFFEHNIASLDSLKAKANFYKCGDLLSTPHFISWAPVKTKTPNFHCPEYFAEVEFADR